MGVYSDPRLLVGETNSASAAGGVTVNTFKDISQTGSLINTGNSTDIAVGGRGLLRVGDADTRLEADYELLLADPGVREVMDDVRERWRWYPRVLRHSVTLSHLGEALWRDCYPAACAIDKKRARY